ncbi:MAG: J domain-containing protein [Lachnospiraceae bacterium]|nr:J domain-containing protein [Lachnospiraceae bacterium]
MGINMEMDLNMTSAMAFAVLGIEATKDESQIRSAYRAALQSNNPEDNPSGFQSVRRAYEKALEYSRTYDDGDEQVKADMPDADTPIGAFMLKLDKTYKSISARINPEAWKELLRDEVFSGLEDYEAARRALFGYLAENYRVPREIYILLDQYFQIKENAQELKEWLPVAFVDFILSNINNAVSGYTCEWMGMLRGADDADYDAFLVYLQELERAYFNTKEQARAFG